MDRREFICLVTMSLLAAPLGTGAQQAGKMYRIGFLGTLPPIPGNAPAWDAFAAGLREGGWIQDQNLLIEARYSEGRVERFPNLVAELVRLKVDVIFAGGGPASLRAASDATTTIPIVMAAASVDPIGEGFIKSFARPGGNITGLVANPEELWGKRLELLKEAVPGLSRVGLLWDVSLTSRAFDSAWKQTEEAAKSLRVELLSFKVHEPREFDSVVSAAAAQRVGALILSGTPMSFQHRTEIATILIKHRMPAILNFREFAEAGFLMTYGVSLAEQFRRAAYFINKILRGAKPADLPVEQPANFRLVINLKTAKALGLTIPRSLLLRADEVIE